MSAPLLPPLDASLTVPAVLDFQLLHNPDLPAYVFSAENSEQTTSIPFRELVRACHRAAFAVRPIGTGHDRETVAVIALTDTCVYHTTVLGILRAGLVVNIVILFSMKPKLIEH